MDGYLEAARDYLNSILNGSRATYAGQWTLIRAVENILQHLEAQSSERMECSCRWRSSKREWEDPYCPQHGKKSDQSSERMCSECELIGENNCSHHGIAYDLDVMGLEATIPVMCWHCHKNDPLPDQILCQSCLDASMVEWEKSGKLARRMDQVSGAEPSKPSSAATTGPAEKPYPSRIANLDLPSRRSALTAQILDFCRSIGYTAGVWVVTNPDSSTLELTLRLRSASGQTRAGSRGHALRRCTCTTANNPDCPLHGYGEDGYDGGVQDKEAAEFMGGSLND